MESGQVTQREISKLYNVSEVVIREIRLGHNWVDISKEYNVSNCKMIANKPIDDEKVIKICELLLEDKLTIKEIATLMEVTPHVVLSIYKKEHHKHISERYDFSNYSKRCRYSENLINEVRTLITNGFSSDDIIKTTNLPRGQKTNTFLYRRKYLEHEMETMGAN